MLEFYGYAPRGLPELLPLLLDSGTDRMRNHRFAEECRGDYVLTVKGIGKEKRISR